MAKGYIILGEPDRRSAYIGGTKADGGEDVRSKFAAAAARQQRLETGILVNSGLLRAVQVGLAGPDGVS